MNLRSSRLDCIPLDRCLSTSGKYEIYLLQRYSPVAGKLTEYAIGIGLAATHRLLKLVHIGYDNAGRARERYEEFKKVMTERPGPQLDDISMFEAFQGKTRKELPLPKLVPVNNTAIVEEIVDEDATLKRAKEAGLHIPDEADQRQNRSTRGRIIAMSAGFRESLHTQGVPVVEGDVVWFGLYAGSQKFLNGRKLRTLFAHEITDVEVPDESATSAT